jgi:hypothetical protein
MPLRRSRQKTNLFVDRFQLAHADAAGPLPLWCAARWAQAALAGSDCQGPAAPRTRHVERGAAAARRPWTAVPPPECAPRRCCQHPRCASGAARATSGAIAALSATAALMADARQSVSNSRKNEAMLALMVGRLAMGGSHAARPSVC